LDLADRETEFLLKGLDIMKLADTYRFGGPAQPTISGSLTYVIHFLLSLDTLNQVGYSGSLNCLILFVLPIEMRHQRQNQIMAQSRMNIE
jgi:hypothetical protein